MDIIKFADMFYSMEKDLDLFSKHIDGDFWWDPVRHDVFNIIYYSISNVSQANLPKANFAKRVINFLRRKSKAICFYLKINFQTYDVIVLRAPRHLGENGQRVDLIIDDIVEVMPGKKLVIDTFPDCFHISLPSNYNQKIESKDFLQINSEVFLRFGCDVDVQSLIELTWCQYKSAFKKYEHLLDKIAPKFILVVQNGIEKALFKAARRRSIPVAEAQHGLINYAHPAYSYPAEMNAKTLETLPSVFLAFSSYWADKCHYPVEKTIVVGNRQLFVEPSNTKSEDVLVISSFVHEESIEDVLVPTAHLLPHRQFIYKLHPNQFVRLSEIKNRLNHLKNIQVVSNERNLQQISKRCGFVFCINSTGVYETLQSGLRVCLLAKQDFQKHSDVFDHPGVHIVNDQDDLVRVLTEFYNIDNKNSYSNFFEKFDALAVANLTSGIYK